MFTVVACNEKPRYGTAHVFKQRIAVFNRHHARSGTSLSYFGYNVLRYDAWLAVYIARLNLDVTHREPSMPPF